MKGWSSVGQSTFERSLQLVSFQDRANTLFKQMTDTGGLRGRSSEANCAACLYIGCRQEGVPRTFKEICAGHFTAKWQTII